MAINADKLLHIKQYIADNFVPGVPEGSPKLKQKCAALTEQYGLYDDVDKLRKRVNKNISDSWQESLFSIIDSKFLDEVEVYKRGGLTKQTFSKIRSNSEYHPDKDTAIRLCIGLKLNIDEALDLLGKAGYTLSPSIERDLIIRYFIENKEYDIYEMDCVLDELGMKQFLKY